MMKRSAFTLIEVVLSLLLASAVVGVTGVAAVQSVRVQRAVRAVVASQWQTVQIVGQLESDMASAITWLPENTTPVTAGTSPGELLRVYCLADGTAPGTLARFRLPSEVRYLIEDLGDGTGGKRLVREVRDLTVTAAAVGRTLTSDLTDAYVEVRTKNTWSRPTGRSNKRETAEAIRIVLHLASKPNEPVIRTFKLPETRAGRRSP